ncbi:helix-turn-helix domain-containing protein [Lysobacter sp. BMK333-48F3]|nr:helix-turn-helix domain-containing protein [Lysobacter sp. BMK333-48F3]
MPSMSTRIRRARRFANFSQTQLAGRVGVQRSAVAQWEQAGGTSPSVDHLARVALATGVCFEWLATGRGRAQPNGGDFDMAVTMQDFAQSETEGRMLELIRRLPPKKQRMACSILDLLAG